MRRVEPCYSLDHGPMPRRPRRLPPTPSEKRKHWVKPLQKVCRLKIASFAVWFCLWQPSGHPAGIPAGAS